MADLNSSDRRKLEKLFCMGSGYVLGFSDRTFKEFFVEYGVNIDAVDYCKDGSSKAKRMRAFWTKDSNNIVGKVIIGLIEYGLEEGWLTADSAFLGECNKVAEALLFKPITDSDVLQSFIEKPDFELVTKQILASIEIGQFSAALDRLHTFMVRFVRDISEERGVKIEPEKSLQSLFGEYVKKLKGNELISVMEERLLKTNISVLEIFNDVRNSHSLAHVNQLLNADASELIINNIVSLVKFIKTINRR